MMPVQEPILKLNDVTKYFGGVIAVDNLSLDMSKSDILGAIGPNGAGKTTFFNLITGVFPLTSGDIYFNGGKISGLKPHRIAQTGIARTYQNIRLFESLTVYEHVRYGQFIHKHFNGNQEQETAGREHSLKEEAQEVLAFLGILNLKKECARSLAYGQQRRVEIARALATKPRLLLLDEPTAGMNLDEKKEILQIMQKISDRGISIIVIEHDMRLVMNVCTKIVMLNFGKKIAEGTPKEISENKMAKEIYLGKE
jgi:branched-chain amino acid transport system ATP-binding protein